MLSNLLFTSFTNALDSLIHLDMSDEAVAMSVLFSAAGAVILGKFTGTFGNLTVPLNFSALFIGTADTNSLLNGVDIPTIQYQQEVLLYTVVGMITGSFGMLWFVRPERQ